MRTELSALIAGCMNWGITGKNLSTNEMEKLLQACLDYGITTFDHADIYGGYTTEAAFGKAFKKSGIERNKIQLITKCGIQHTTGNRENKLKHYDYSKEYIVRSVENSLKNLNTHYIDVLLLHRPSPLMQPDEIGEAVNSLKQQGKILDFGVSNFTNHQIELIRSRTEVACNQIEFSAIAHHAMTNGTLDYMFTNNIKPLAWSPIGNIFKFENNQTERIKLLLVELMAKYEVMADVILLAWILKHPAGIIPITGSTNEKRLKNQVKALELDLDLEDWFAIWTESMGHKVP